MDALLACRNATVRLGAVTAYRALAGVGQHEVDRAVVLLHRMRQGRTVILTEHNMEVMMALADRIVVMAHGAVPATGTPQEMRADEVLDTDASRCPRRNRSERC